MGKIVVQKASSNKDKSNYVKSYVDMIVFF